MRSYLVLLSIVASLALAAAVYTYLVAVALGVVGRWCDRVIARRLGLDEDEIEGIRQDLRGGMNEDD